MPDLTGQATTLRGKRYQTRAFLSYLPQTVVFAGCVNGTPTFPTKTITVDTITTGTISDPVEGQTIEFFDHTTGLSKGKTRIAYGAGSGSTLQIAELSAGSILIQDNDTFKVYDEYRIWDKLVSATAALNKDSRIAYSDQGSNPPPVANAGGLWAGFLDSGQTYATVTFDASGSYVIDPDSGGSLTYLWDVDDGTITVGSTTSSSITVQFPAGFRHVKLTVTDSGNSKSTVRYVPVFVHSRVNSSSDYPKSVRLDNRTYTAEGWTCQFQLPVGSEAALSNVPDGALVVIWEDEQYGSTNASYGSNVSNRSHIKFVGYLDNEQISIDADTNEVIFTAISSLGVLAKTPCLPQLTVQSSAPTTWQELKTNSVYRTLWYLWHWHTTAFTYFDFVRPVSTDLQYTRLATTVVSNALDQFRDIAGSLNLNATCDRLGRLIMDTEPQLEDSSARSLRTTAYDFTTADMVRVEWTKPHSGSVKQVVGEGITDGSTSAANIPVYAKYPGSAPGPYGTGVETMDKQIVADQDDINQRTVLYGAMLNGLYNGRLVPKGLRLTLRGGYDVLDPALQEFVTLALPATTNKRGASFTSSTRWIVREAEITYDPETGSKEVVYTLDHETYAEYDDFQASDITYVPPQSADLGLGSFDDIDLNFPGWDLPVIGPGGDTIASGTPTLALFGSDGYVYRTSDGNTPSAAGGPTWTRTSLGVTGTVYSFVVDAFSPLYLGTGTEVNGWVYTQGGSTRRIYRVTDIFGSVSAVQQFSDTLSSGTVIGAYLAAERAFSGFVIAFHTAGSVGAHIIQTSDGSSWTAVSVGGNYNTNTNLELPCGHVSGKVAGLAYASGMTASGASQLYKSTDYGANWTTTGINLSEAGLNIHVPFHDNPNDDLVYLSNSTNNNSQTGAVMRRVRLSSGSATNIAATTSLYSGYTFCAYGARALSSAPTNRLKLLMSGLAFYPFGSYKRVLFRSYDGGDTWETLQDMTGGTVYTNIDISGGNSDHAYLWGNAAFAFTPDFGTTLDSRLGNIATLGTTPTFVGLCGG